MEGSFFMNRRLLPVLIFLLMALCGFAFAESAPAATAAPLDTVAQESRIAEKAQPALIQTVAAVNGKINDFVWGVPAMALILGVGLYLTIGTRVIQVRRLGASLKETIGKVFSRKKAGAGAVTPFQAVCTALAATVGTGNIAGVAGAIALGGPGAVFWMWISAFLGMCTKFVEVTLAVRFRERNEKGDWVGGPMYYIKNGLKKHWHWLAYVFTAFGILATFGIGSATQVNSIVTSVGTTLKSFEINANFALINLILGILVALFVAIVLLGGIKRLARVTELLVPFMAALYIIMALGVVFGNIKSVPGAFAAIFEGAFNPRAVTGGVIGSVFLSMKKGIARGIFSNEAGLGTASIAHASADTDDPVRQGLFGIFEVFVDTIIICTLTALVVMVGGAAITYGSPAGADLTMSGFIATYGSWATIPTAIALCCFALSTILGWGLYGSRFVEFLFGHKAIKPFMIIFSLIAIVGATLDLGLLWDIADTFNGLMSIPNLIAVALLSPVAFKLVREHEKAK